MCHLLSLLIRRLYQTTGLNNIKKDRRLNGGQGDNRRKEKLMINNIILFENSQFGQIRTVGELFIAIDIANNLGYQNGSRDINRHVDECDRTSVVVHDGSQNRTMTAINESGVYSLIFGSTLPTAKDFKRWVTSEILPSIRKHGVYATNETLETMLNDPDTMIRTLQALKSERNARLQAEEQIRIEAPKVAFANSVSVSDSAILVGDFAKILKQNGFNIGANRLFQWLRDNKYLISRQGTDYNNPTQHSMDLGLFKIKETVISHGDGYTTIGITPKITGKGQTYLMEKFMAGRSEP